jgi:A/G-specific adenine glycosylase
MTDFSLLITDWYRQNKRDLPWRNTNDPYNIWLSEIILQQTRVDQGLSYYFKFIETFPTVNDLAEASEQSVLNLWQGLGYYSRARNLHTTAKYIAHELNGVFPNNYADLLKLKGVGSYTAAAIASFSFKEPIAVVDGNVYRVLSRYFNIETPIDSTLGKNQFAELAQSLIDKHLPDIYNQAIMEFGAIQCTPNNPDCNNCPLNTSCLALADNSIKLRPQKSKKIVVKDRFFHFFIFNNGEQTIIEKRESKDIWQNMFQFPLIETSTKSEKVDFRSITELEPELISTEIVHLLSHQRLHAKFYHFSTLPAVGEKKWMKIKLEDLQDYPLPRLIDRYLES